MLRYAIAVIAYTCFSDIREIAHNHTFPYLDSRIYMAILQFVSCDVMVNTNRITDIVTGSVHEVIGNEAVHLHWPTVSLAYIPLWMDTEKAAYHENATGTDWIQECRRAAHC